MVLSERDMSVEAEYYRRYEELQLLLEQAYVDIYSLEEIENYNKSIQRDGRAMMQSCFNVLGHICELIKADLGLTIWKMYSDDDSKASTIKSLSSFVHQNCAEKIDVSALPNMSLSRGLRDAESRLKILRKNYLAHNDSQKLHVSIQLSEMVFIVDELRGKLNGLCFTDLNPRVSQITDKRLMSIKSNVSIGLGMMIYRSTIPIKNNSVQ